MTLRLCSSAERGRFVSIDGPSGAGKSTIVRHLAQMLVAMGEDVYVAAEPSDWADRPAVPRADRTVTGYALACLSRSPIPTWPSGSVYSAMTWTSFKAGRAWPSASGRPRALTSTWHGYFESGCRDHAALLARDGDWAQVARVKTPLPACRPRTQAEGTRPDRSAAHPDGPLCPRTSSSRSSKACETMPYYAAGAPP
jgi:energy-coupling factor transporter ATP-binding protein EcfA2